MAIETYLDIAYADGVCPASVKTKVQTIRLAAAESLFDGAWFEADKTQPPLKYALRLGNRVYPHMKLVVEAAPDRVGHLFRVDTHDQHVRPKPGTKDAELFTQLMNENQRLSAQIESAWEQVGLPTFKAFLRDDLARRKAANDSGSRGFGTG